MPWFRKSLRLRQKGRISKKDISDPIDFQHCYHALYDQEAAGFKGLPPQWTSLVDSKEVNAPCSTTAATTAGECSPLEQSTSDGRLEEATRDATPCSGEGDEQFLDIHLGSQSAFVSARRRASLDPGQIISCSRDSPGFTNTATSAASPNKRCLSVSNDGISRRLDSALYEPCMSESDTHLSRTRMHSPSESSGYFSSTVSHLYWSRLSSMHEETASSRTTIPSSPHVHRCHAPTNPQQGHKLQWSHTQQQCSRVGPQKYSSLQQPARSSREVAGRLPLAQTSSAMGKFASPSESSYDARKCPGTNRMSSSLSDQVHISRQRLERLQDLQFSTSKVLSNEQFRRTLEALVNPNDPREDFVDFVQIGAGSTGIVYSARQMSTNKVVAVKKMDIWKQQRKELLFNEVRIKALRMGHTYTYGCSHLHLWVLTYGCSHLHL